MRVVVVALGAAALGVALLAGGIGPEREGAVAAAPGAERASDVALMSAIAEREYWASATERGLQAPNRAHDLRSFFDPSGVRVHARVSDTGSPLVAMSLATLGRGDGSRAVPPGVVGHARNRVEIARDEIGLREWYVNGADGLEQGFTLADRPEGEGALVLGLALTHASATQANDALELRSDDGSRTLRYAKLVAFDADEKTLPAWIELADARTIRLVVDDVRARYPIVVDPLISEIFETEIEANQASAFLGTSAESAGDVNGDGYADVIVGAPGFDAGHDAEGAAFIFHGSATGFANAANPATAATQIESNQIGAELGISVDGAGDVNGDGYADVIVGAYLYSAGQVEEGAAFVFHGSAAGIPDGSPAAAAASIQSNQISANAGYRVAGGGDVNGDGYADVLVSAHLFDNGTTNEGVVGVFHGSATGIGNGTILTAEALLEGGQLLEPQFGAALDIVGDVNGDGYDDVAVGAYQYDQGQSNEGAVFVFHGGASGVGSQSASAADDIIQGGQAGASLGFSVAAAGDHNGDGYADIIMGAPDYDFDDVPLQNIGVAVVAYGSATGVPSGTIGIGSLPLPGTPLGSTVSPRRGFDVAGLGDIDADGCSEIAIGSPFYDALGQIGNVDVYRGCDGVFGSNPLRLFGSQADARFGQTVAGAGDINGDGFADTLIAAPAYNSGQTDEGSVFVYLGSGLIQTILFSDAAKLYFISTQVGSRFGASIAGAGDVNGDGLSDVIVGAPDYDAGQADEGAAFIFHGTEGAASLEQGEADAILQSNEVGADFGFSVAGAGDVNSDGYADVIVGAPGYDGPDALEGSAFIFLGSPSGVADGTPSNAAAELASDQNGARFAVAVAGVGDVNGDGYGDVGVGAPDDTIDQTGEGAVYLFHGGPSGVPSGGPTDADTRLESNEVAPAIARGADFGESLAGAGDVNGDGFADVIVGSPSFDAGQSDEGAAFIYHGATAGIPSGGPATAATQLEGNATAENLGFSVASANDVNRDGYADVIVGSPAVNRAYVFHGSPTGVPDGDPASADTSLTRAVVAQFGYSVAGVGDIDGDGYPEVFVGSPGSGSDNDAQALAYNGGPNGVETTPYGVIREDQLVGAQVRLGFDVAGIGDWNGDGFADVALSDPDSESGRAYGFFGNDSWFIEPYNPRRANPRQGTGDPLLPLRVQPFGLSESESAFTVLMRGTHPEGRERVKLQVETCPAGDTFGDAGCVVTTQPIWSDSGTTSSGPTLIELVSGLQDDTLYHWRARVLYAPFRVTEVGITPPPNPAHGPWRRLYAGATEADIRTGLGAPDPDTDLDGIADAFDNCPTVANTPQEDGDGDRVGDLCDNCVQVSNPRVPVGELGINTWMTLTGEQRDDDHDGYGNRCDAKFPGVTGLLVGPGDLTQFRASNGKSRIGDTCGTLGTRPCAIFDLDESALLIGPADLTRFRALNGKVPGPKCAVCPLECVAGSSGSCD